VVTSIARSFLVQADPMNVRLAAVSSFASDARKGRFDRGAQTRAGSAAFPPPNATFQLAPTVGSAIDNSGPFQKPTIAAGAALRLAADQWPAKGQRRPLDTGAIAEGPSFQRRAPLRAQEGWPDDHRRGPNYVKPLSWAGPWDPVKTITLAPKPDGTTSAAQLSE
jgi:hypothetical protein